MENYRYYKGEKDNPFKSKDFGKAFWWTMELYAVERGDHKEKGVLSPTMVEYIKEKMWDGDGQHDTTWKTALKRATEMYLKGIWNRSYISCNNYTFEEAERMNKVF